MQNYDFIDLVYRHWSNIRCCAEAATYRSPTELEQYIRDRLNGFVTNKFLDDLPMNIATRLCEVLGFVLTCGPERLISSASEDELRRARQAGFDALRAGEEGLYTAMASLVSPVALQTLRHRADLGAFFEWLRLSVLSKEFEGLRDLVRDFIFDAYPVGKNELVLGQYCKQPKAFTVNSAGRSLKMQYKRMNRFLIGAGLAEMQEGRRGVRLNAILRKDDLNEIADRMAGRLSAAETCKYLNISLVFLLRLRAAGILNTVTDALNQVPKYEKFDLESLMTRLKQQVKDQAKTRANMMPIAAACRRSACTADEVVGVMLDGKLQNVTYRDEIAGMAGFEVDIGEVRRALPQLEMPGVTKGEACNRLRMTYRSINFLVAEGILSTVRALNPKSRQSIDAVTKTSIGSFLERFETLGWLAVRYSWQPGPLGCHLEAKGVCPIETPRGISWYYDRRGLEQRLQKAGLMKPK